MHTTPLKLATLVCVGLGALAVGTLAHAKLSASGKSTTATPVNARASVVRVPLKPVNGFGQSGVAILTPSKFGFTVLVRMRGRNAQDGGQHDHIHKVTCARYARIAPNPHQPTGQQIDKQLLTVAIELSDLFPGGKSKTDVSQPLKTVTTGGYSINVHIPGYPYTAVACGNIPKRP